MKDFLKFSKRRELSKKIDDYLAETGISINTLGVITTLSITTRKNTGICSTARNLSKRNTGMVIQKKMLGG